MLFLSFAVTAIIVDVQLLARRREGGMAQIVADQPQIHLLVGHVGTRAMPEPVGRCLLKAIHPLFIRIAARTQAARNALENLLHNLMERSARQWLSCHSDGQHQGRRFAGDGQGR
jgi:hypothetical protein